MSTKPVEPSRLKLIAKRQRHVCVSILLLICISIASAIFNKGGMTAGAYGHWTSILYFVVSIYALVCAISLLYNAYNSVIIAFIFGIFLIVPCINFLVLLCASLKATKILKEAGYKVGLLGADMNQFD